MGISKENILRKRNSELQENLEKLQSELDTLKDKINSNNYDKLFSDIRGDLSNINEQINKQCEEYETLICDLTNYKNDIRKIFLEDAFSVPYGNK